MKKSTKESIFSNPRLNKACKAMDQFCKEVYEFPLLVKGKSGSGKTHFVLEYMKEKGLPYVFLTVPDHKDYFEYICESLTRYESAMLDHTRESEESDNPDYKKAVKESECPFIIIDEAHQTGINPEDFQHEKGKYSFGDVEVPYSRLIFISHAALGKNNSENNRLKKIVIPTPNREEIMETLMKTGMKKDCALWSVTHSPCNFHSAIETSKDFGTDLQGTYNPRGLESDSIDCLYFYFQADPVMKSIYSDQFQFENVGCNTIGNCIAFLGLDKKAVQDSESILKEEGLLVTGEQSKRVIVTSEKSIKLTLAILKLGGRLKEIEQEKPQKEKLKKEQPKKTTPKSKAQSKPSANKASAKPQTKQTGKAKGKASAKSANKAQTKPSKSSVSESYAEFRNGIEIPIEQD